MSVLSFMLPEELFLSDIPKIITKITIKENEKQQLLDEQKNTCYGNTGFTDEENNLTWREIK